MIKTGLLMLLGIALLLGFEIAMDKIHTLEKENTGLKTVISSQKEDFKGKSGQMMARLEVAELGKKTLENLVKKQIDSLRKEFGQPLKQIQQYQEINTNTINHLMMSGSDIKLLNASGDSSTVKVFKYQDKWTKRQDTLEGNTLRSSSSIRNDLKILVRKGKREKWWQIWKDRKLVAEVFSGNPNTKIKDFQILKVIDK
jgi:hypothetical protein